MTAGVNAVEHQRVVADLVAAGKRSSGGVDALEDELRIVVIRVNGDRDDFEPIESAYVGFELIALHEIAPELVKGLLLFVRSLVATQVLTLEELLENHVVSRDRPQQNLALSLGGPVLVVEVLVLDAHLALVPKGHSL